MSENILQHAVGFSRLKMVCCGDRPIGTCTVQVPFSMALSITCNIVSYPRSRFNSTPGSLHHGLSASEMPTAQGPATQAANLARWQKVWQTSSPKKAYEKHCRDVPDIKRLRKRRPRWTRPGRGCADAADSEAVFEVEHVVDKELRGSCGF
eukprot:gnl/TRDRNA2_/TRDRNA2_91349_c0_seq1.p1 gnl/TRDRNA2_/TRDRNA2_91349_c0~~gnl/TRDRNA2_/TRDRNA2_91349_c0_seq1.p1  ORF type:complete len:151 (+),score=5.00 gnl/TRDRNA2_/TRDRNA2_91349_c0_seq1:91-543(+)